MATKRTERKAQTDYRRRSQSVESHKDIDGEWRPKKRKRGEPECLPSSVSRIPSSRRRSQGADCADPEQGRLVKLQKRRRRRGVDTPQPQKNAVDGVGIDAGFTMFKPRPDKQNDVVDTAPGTERTVSAAAPVMKSAKFLDRLRVRLAGGQFRSLNETLYTCKGEEAYTFFKTDPSAFTLYHSGYQKQMSQWPVIPVEVVISWLKCRSPNLVVADFGCGDARLAKCVKNKVFSLDLISTDPAVIACNMAQTPLRTACVDVAVFCLSLMGTDYPNFIKEAYRVLKASGMLLIAEVKSRFDSGNGGASPQQFIAALESLGFSLISQDASNKMFIMFYLQKAKGSKDLSNHNIQWPVLSACIYKRR